MKKSLILLLIFSALQTGYSQKRHDAVLEAIALSSRGETEESLSILGEAIEGGATAGLYLTRAEIYLNASMIKEAKADFMSAGRLEQGSGIYGLACCAAAEGDASGAVEYLEAHLKSGVRKSEPEIVLDNRMAGISSSPEWRALWKKEWYKGYERKKWEIENYLKSGQNEMASETYASLAAEYPGTEVTEYCGALMKMAAGRYGEALKFMEPLTADAYAKPEYLFKLAEAYAGKGDYKAAASVYGRLIAAEYPDAKLYLRRADMLSRAGERKAATADIQKYLGFYPDDFRALSLLGKILAEEGAIYDALPYLNRNVETHPGESKAFSLRGDAWFASRTWDKAAEDYAMSLDLDPENPTVNLNLGISLINSGKTGEACHYLRKAKELGDKNATQYLSKYCIK